MSSSDLFRSQYESLNGSAPAWVRRLRTAGMARFTALGLPTTKLEDWKYTDVSPIARIPFGGAVSESAAAADLVARYSLAPGPRLVFVNGRYNESLSTVAGLAAGVQVGPLGNAFEEHAGILEPHLARVADLESQSFIALNTAFLQDGAFVHLRRGAIADHPIHLLFVSLPAAGAPSASHPRVLVVAEEGSEAVIVEDYVGDGGVYLSNAVSEIVVGDDAKIDHYKLQREGAEGFHLATVDAKQGRDSRFRSYVLSLGASLARVAIQATMDAEGGECVFDGLYMANHRQHVDHQTCIDHRKPRCTSRELYKGVLDGNAKGVFSGKVYVRPDAQKSDAQQMNNNLLLSDDARIDTKPQLEIFADDVKCSHGATIGRLDDAALFYFRSRGIDAKTARDLLIRGFANQLISRMPSEPVRAQVQRSLADRWGWTPEAAV